VDLSVFLAGWLTVFVVSGLAMISPGPNYAVTVKHGLLHSRRAGIWSAAGVAAGNLVHVVFSLLGLAMVVSQSIILFGVLKWFGAAYLIYLGLKSLTASRQEADEGAEIRESAATSVARVLRSSFLVSVLNPKVTLFYLVLFTQVVEIGTPLIARVVYGFTAVALSFGWYALVALFVSTAPIKRRFDAVAHWIERLTGAVLILLGIRLALARSSG
jgi:RhtB (resistance to homoserine/threonine) family protein